jgi:hypothetical protein
VKLVTLQTARPLHGPANNVVYESEHVEVRLTDIALCIVKIFRASFSANDDSVDWLAH